ncbi:uncharacterized protein [Choristoneura fumiferana]|uniref:uncharacterized protein n=1 Tax=Choristoneura fumiferana TaxID=7141 RepID=UPI003D15F28C
MCEWLSREEWCDVRLLCGGRAFGAHRAVLASVSSFLRRLLLSCPIEETPTLIVLPDFDLEAMSAVLYYIYNGEVTMPKQKLEKFLDIIKAMQIFIDRQYLTQLSDNIQEIDFNTSKYITEDDHIFILREESDDKTLVNFKKLFQHHNSRSISKDEADYSEFAQGSRQNWNEQIRPSLGDLRSWHGDRQRDYFLRGSFMETYPRNGNTNGRAAGVPAIPNKCYRTSTSLLLTNANANGYLSSDDAFLPTSKQIVNADRPAPCKVKSGSQLYNSNPENTILTELRRKLSPEMLNDVWQRHQPGLKAPSFEILQQSEDCKRTNYLDLSILHQPSQTLTYSPMLSNNFIVDKIPSISNLENDCKNIIVNSNVKNTPDTSQNRVAILNKALENPWCPRLPNCFRPFRRKNNITSVSNDNNNNIQVEQSVSVKDEISRESTGFHNNFNFTGSTTCDDKEYANDQALLPSEIVSARSRYACSECSKTFSQLRNFKYHMSVHRGTKEFAASCTVCGKCFNDRGYLSSHMKIHRNRKEYKCSLCPKSFNQRVAYNMHVRIHTGVKPHVCPQCGKAFSRKMLLKQHQRTHSGERPYACPHCDKRFADRSNMTLHLRLHTGIKPFKCPMCPKSFTKKHHLKSHVNFHTGAKPYSCPRCNLAFTQSSNMRTHLKRCTAPEPAIDDKQAA